MSSNSHGELRKVGSVTVSGMLVALLSACAGLLIAAPVWAHSGDVLSNYSHPVVDGVISPGEYDGSCVGPIFENFPPVGYNFSICEANDDKNDYYAISIDDLTHDTSIPDTAYLFFDNNHDGVIEACSKGTEDLLTVDANAFALGDGNWCHDKGGGLELNGDDSLDGQAAAKFTPGVGYVYEFSHPLKSGDPLDYALKIGDTVGWCFGYFDASNPTVTSAIGQVEYPSLCFKTAAGSGGSAGWFGDVVKVGLGSKLAGTLNRIRSMLEEAPPCPGCPFELFTDLGEAERLVRQAQHSNPQDSAKGVAKLETSDRLLGSFIDRVRGDSAGIDRVKGRGTAALWIEQAGAIRGLIEALVGAPGTVGGPS
jgi:hypothetical protein